MLRDVEFKMIEFNISCRRNGRDTRRAAPMKTAATVAIAIASIVIGKAHAADMSPYLQAPRPSLRPLPTATTPPVPTATTTGVVFI